MSIESQLKEMQKQAIKEAEVILKKEVERLKDCIQNRIDEYMDSYSPILYQRTGGFQNSLYVDDFLDINIETNRISVKLAFGSGAYHNSGDGILGWNGNGEEVNVAILLEYGYQVQKDVWFKNIENFGYRHAGRFVQNGINDFNKNNPYGIKIDYINEYDYFN